MSKLTPRERAAIKKRVKALNARIQDPRLWIEQIDELHKERAALQARLLEDRAANDASAFCVGDARVRH